MLCQQLIRNLFFPQFLYILYKIFFKITNLFFSRLPIHYNNNPVILSVNKAGKYTNHTVVIIGYNEETNELLIHDNWRILI